MPPKKATKPTTGVRRLMFTDGVERAVCFNLNAVIGAEATTGTNLLAPGVTPNFADFRALVREALREAGTELSIEDTGRLMNLAMIPSITAALAGADESAEETEEVQP